MTIIVGRDSLFEGHSYCSDQWNIKLININRNTASCWVGKTVFIEKTLQIQYLFGDLKLWIAVARHNSSDTTVVTEKNNVIVQWSKGQAPMYLIEKTYILSIWKQ